MVAASLIEFDAVTGRRYGLEARDDFTIDVWAPTGNTLQATTSGRVFFETELTVPSRFFRVTVEKAGGTLSQRMRLEVPGRDPRSADLEES